MHRSAVTLYFIICNSSYFFTNWLFTYIILCLIKDFVADHNFQFEDFRSRKVYCYTYDLIPIVKLYFWFFLLRFKQVFVLH